MTAFGIALGWLALRVSIVAAAALALVALARRRAARSTVVLLAGTMVMLAVLPLASFFPLPDAWHWTIA